MKDIFAFLYTYCVPCYGERLDDYEGAFWMDFNAKPGIFFQDETGSFFQHIQLIRDGSVIKDEEYRIFTYFQDDEVAEYDSVEHFLSKVNVLQQVEKEYQATILSKQQQVEIVQKYEVGIYIIPILTEELQAIHDATHEV